MNYISRLLCWKLAELSLHLLNIGVLIAPVFLEFAIASVPGLVLQALGGDVLVGLFLVFVTLIAVHVWVAAPYIWPAAMSATQHIGRYMSETNHQFWLERNRAHSEDGEIK